MALTDSQLEKLAQYRRRSPPTFYNSATGENEPISQTTEDALILLPSSVKQQAAQYIDDLINANPLTDDRDVITREASEVRVTTLEAAVTELETVTSKFESFRDALTGGNDQREKLFADGVAPLLQSLLRGVGSLTNNVERLRHNNKIFSFAEARHAGGLTDENKKEWRSWKRVLVSYVV